MRAKKTFDDVSGQPNNEKHSQSAGDPKGQKDCQTPQDPDPPGESGLPKHQKGQQESENQHQ